MVNPHSFSYRVGHKMGVLAAFAAKCLIYGAIMGFVGGLVYNLVPSAPPGPEPPNPQEPPGPTPSA